MRGFSPFINLYAATFLIGGAILSAVRYRRIPGMGNRVTGNVLIAVGALLPGIGGTFTRFGHVEVLYVTEFVGILLIYLGYKYNIATGPSPLGRARAASAVSPAVAVPAPGQPLP
ncbi:MAG: hypothetical protein OEM23_02135 [Gemmatimonadota bacterium]|nr:hypothetical protein [Gemmatimonadota bacterium]MDH3427208.1 hypothetical protein [Gemmatimonadota bacterium]